MLTNGLHLLGQRGRIWKLNFQREVRLDAEKERSRPAPPVRIRVQEGRGFLAIKASQLDAQAPGRRGG